MASVSQHNNVGPPSFSTGSGRDLRTTQHRVRERRLKRDLREEAEKSTPPCLSAARGENGLVTTPDASQEPPGQNAEDIGPALYDELRAIAARFLKDERANHTLQPTALVYEAFLKLAGQNTPTFQDQTHFRIVAATAMRQILVDHARARATSKRGGNGQWIRITLDAALPGLASNAQDDVDLLALDEALNDR